MTTSGYLRNPPCAQKTFAPTVAITSNQLLMAPPADPCEWMAISSDANRNISGFSGGTDGKTLTVVNMGTVQFTLINNAGSPNLNDRMILGANVVVGAGRFVELVYSTYQGRWMMGL